MVCHALWLYHPMELCKVNTVKDLKRILVVLRIKDLLVTNQYI